ncbi:MAG: CapA family protein [Deltaproteobacteria bacterium]|nr:CapA family protein [Deltaproteobacteria bacterium]
MAVGDILIHTTVREAASQEGGAFDFSPFFEYVDPILSQGDLVFGNLENPVAGADRGFSGYPAFNAPDELVDSLKKSGFTTLSVANNHSLDRGWKGLASTLEILSRYSLDYSGAYLSEDDKAQRLYSIYNGVGIAVLAYTYGLNGPVKPPIDDPYRLQFIDAEQIFQDIAFARDNGADFVIVSLHYGDEYKRLPNAAQKKLVNALFQGAPDTQNTRADLILGHHPHVVEPFAALKDGLVLQPLSIDNLEVSAEQAVMFSLGNFLSGQTKAYTHLGLIFDCLLTVHPDGEKTISDVRLIPTYCYSSYREGKRYIRVLPLALAVEDPQKFGLTESEHSAMTTQLEELSNHLTSMGQEQLLAGK